MTRAMFVILPVVALALSAGCSQNEPGSALTSDTPASTQHSGASNAPTSAPSNASTASIEPCSLLSFADVSSFGTFKERPEEDEGLGARSCTYYPERTDAARLPTVGVDVRDDQDVDSVNDEGLGINTGELNGRNLAQVPAHGGCIIALGVGAGSRVDVAVTGLDTDASCDLVGRVAEIVEPKLPEG
ncbi:DUF3558 family protein [Prauserella sp. PE36]|uniref:DUF3558 family protein n=1 Tax=Prauserella sp. PE36 TaxID=1504709 RepID=UPI001314FFFF|nr:DUF3558 family protein [Prauserella sp. PE36]